MKRLLVFMLAFCVVLSMTACVGNAPAEEPTVPVTEPPASEGLAFNVYDTYCEVSGIGTCVDKDVVIPSTYNGLPVTRIADKAFEFCSSLNSVTIQGGVTGIGDSAFLGCPILSSVTIPDSVTDIGRSAFEECNYLTSIVIPDGVTSISKGLFDDCINLTSVKIPDGVTSIGDSAFSGCTKLTDIAIPDSVTSIGWGAFYECNSLKYNIIDDAYYFGNSNNPFMVLVKTKYTITSCDIHRDTKFIASDAFSGCKDLSSVTIPEGVTQIGAFAFADCWSLTDITIPSSVTSIDNRAFSGCTSLEYNVYGNACYLGNSSNPFYALISAESTYIDSCDIHTDTKIISGAAFQYCSQLTSISIPTGVTFIGCEAFSACDTLTSIAYEGTTAQWGDIAVDTYWNYRTPATEVICTDGAVSLN